MVEKSALEKTVASLQHQTLLEINNGSKANKQKIEDFLKIIWEINNNFKTDYMDYPLQTLKVKGYTGDINKLPLKNDYSLI